MERFSSSEVNAVVFKRTVYQRVTCCLMTTHSITACLASTIHCCMRKWQPVRQSMGAGVGGCGGMGKGRKWQRGGGRKL